MTRNPFKNIGILVVADLAKRFWPTYLLVGLMAAVILVFQTAGLANITQILSSSKTSGFVIPMHLQKFFPHIYFGKLAGLAISFVLLVSSLILIYFSRKLTVKLMIKYESVCATEIMERLAREVSLKDRSDRQIMTLLSKDCRFGGRIAQELSNIIMPLGMLVIGLPLMVYISPPSTAILVGILFVTTLTYGWLAKRAHRISAAMETSAAQDSKLKKQLIQEMRQNNLPPEKLPMLPHKAFAAAYYRRLVMPYLGILVGGVQLATSLVIITWLAIENSGMLSISSTIVYVYLAVLLLTQLRTAAKVFANFHVFLAYFQRAFIIIKDIEPAEYGITPAAAGTFDLATDDEDEIV